MLECRYLYITVYPKFEFIYTDTRAGHCSSSHWCQLDYKYVEAVLCLFCPYDINHWPIYAPLCILQRQTYLLKPTSNRSPYIFMLVQKVKHRVYKMHAFLNNATLFQDSVSYYI